ncbi:hypothetical protein Fcan01_08813 [Folsomia candida]|uniref:Uncharacterized protein n=1 Tax=Folsomia candida TaxID=158441 RepID=A0A226EDV2_FOLCA|nr:hypothetical protein Fcan01_08813 [Folsomia candida]
MGGARNWEKVKIFTCKKPYFLAVIASKWLIAPDPIKPPDMQITCLKCYICTGRINSSISSEGKQYQYQKPADTQLDKIRRSDQVYIEKMDRAMPCKDFTSTTQKEDRAQVECPLFMSNSICVTSKTHCRECSFNYPVEMGPKFAPMNTCPEGALDCKCNRNLCNGVVFGASKAGNMNDSSKRGVVALLGVSFFVRGYFGGGAEYRSLTMDFQHPFHHGVTTGSSSRISTWWTWTWPSWGSDDDSGPATQCSSCGAYIYGSHTCST